MRYCSLFGAGVVASACALRVLAAPAYFDTFDSGTSSFTASAYYLDAGQQDGLIVKTTTGTTSFPNSISADVSGPGYFLFNGTLNLATPAGQNAFYVSPAFAVAPNTNYALSFYLANANYGDAGPGNPAFAQVQPLVNGAPVGSTFSATGIWNTNGWQKYTFQYNTGAATSDVVTLQNLRTNGPSGNDFGIDEVQVQAVPEPAGLAVVGGMVLFAGTWGRRRKPL